MGWNNILRVWFVSITPVLLYSQEIVLMKAVNPVFQSSHWTERSEPRMYESILVPPDGSGLAEPILPEIEEVASCMQAKIELLRVYRAHVFPAKDPTKAEVKVVR